MHRKRFRSGSYVFAARLIGSALLLVLALQAGSAAAVAVPKPLPTAVTSTFPLGVTGVTINRDGSYTLWVLNTQPKDIVVNGSSIFSIVDVIFKGAPGYRLKIRSGRYCTIAVSGGADTIECLPTINPNQISQVVTFTSNRTYPNGATSTVELNSSSQVTVALNVRIPRSTHRQVAVRSYLAAYSKMLGLTSSVVFVTAGRPTENAYVLSTKSVPRGWVTFVVTNHGARFHSFDLCPNGGLLNTCVASSSGASYATESDDTGALAHGQTAYFTTHFSSPGVHEYLSDVIGQAKRGAKGDLTVTP